MTYDDPTSDFSHYGSSRETLRETLCFEACDDPDDPYFYF
jgi:hypothetical protein